MPFSKTIRRTPVTHLLFWTAIALVWFYLRYQDYASLSQAAAVTIIKVADLALVIYFANLVLVPRFLYKKNYLLFATFFVISVALTSYLKMAELSALLGADYLAGTSVKEKVYNNFVTQFFLVLASIGLKSVVDYLQLQAKMAQMAKEKAEAELNFLKSQINPHFLFNSLNAVFFLIHKENTMARAALHKFSEMLRYQLYECNGEKIPIEKEIRYLEDYVALQRLRVSENTDIQFRCEGALQNFSIEPLLLIPFVENSFKHLSHFHQDRENKVHITLSRQNGSMQFSVYNTTEPHSNNTNAGGIGLANVQKRLELLYPGKHLFAVTQQEDWFRVDLSLSLYQ